MRDDYFNFLVATDTLDDFLGKEDMDTILNELANNYINNLLTKKETQNKLKYLATRFDVDYNELKKVFNEMIKYKKI
jgi:hypothetical protein